MASLLPLDEIGAYEARRRDELVALLMWSQPTNRFGIAVMAIQQVRNTPLGGDPNAEEDLSSIVVVNGPAYKYTDEELAKLAWFSEHKTREYDRQWKIRAGANLIHIDKVADDYWVRRRKSWKDGLMYSTTIDEALEVFL